VPADQTIVLSDPSRVRLEQGLSDALAKAGQARQLLVFIAGRALGSAKALLVAPKDFDRSRADVTGVPLASLLAEVDKCSAAEKVVVLDLPPSQTTENVAGASTASLVDAVRGTRSRPLLKTTSVFAGENAGASDAQTGRLITALASAFAGAADADRDNRLV